MLFKQTEPLLKAACELERRTGLRTVAAIQVSLQARRRLPQLRGPLILPRRQLVQVALDCALLRFDAAGVSEFR
jgi:hypothetical protein